MIKFIFYLLAAITSVVMLFIITLPLSVEVQLFLGLAALLAMFVLKTIPGNLSRITFLSIGSLLVGRYAYWRATQTIPPYDNLFDFIPGVALLIAEMFCILMFFLSAIIVSQPYERPRRIMRNSEDAPSVDVFIPSYNEDPELVACTIAAAVNMDYPKDRFKVFLLDDGATAQKLNSPDRQTAMEAYERREKMQQICADLGASYVARERNEHAKAGNLNNGLKHSEGDLVVVFDADHAPSREFLRETVGHFVDPKLFLVQTPHFFLNPDPVERNLKTFTFMPSENDMFYRLIQKGLDKWDAAFFCGSAAVLRRAALLEVGGFSGVSITEDCETALDLHAKGWKSAYIDRPMIAGLQPETIASFIGQRSRWCRGMLQILLLKNPLFKPGLSVMQRLAYMSSALFWLFPLPRLAFLVAPLLFILFNMKIYIASPQEFLAYTITYILAAVTIQSGIYGRFRWPWVSELYEYIQTIFLFPAIISVLMNPRAPKFNVTSKGDTLEEDQLSVLAWPYILLFGVMAFASGFLVWRVQQDPSEIVLLSVVGVWQLFNLLIAAAALGAVLERKEVRKAPRISISHPAEFCLGDQCVPVTLKEANTNGILMQVDTASLPGNIIGEHGELVFSPKMDTPVQAAGESNLPVLVNANQQRIRVRLASQRNGEQGILVGAAYADSVAKRALASSQLIFADLSVPRALHHRKLAGSSVSFGLLRIIRWAVTYGLRIPLVALLSLPKMRKRPDQSAAAQEIPAPMMTPAE